MFGLGGSTQEPLGERWLALYFFNCFVHVMLVLNCKRRISYDIIIGVYLISVRVLAYFRGLWG